MKKLSLLLIALVFVLSFQSLAQASQLWNGRQTGRLTVPATASAAAVTGGGLFYGLIIVTDGTNNVTVNVYDSTGASGTKLIPTDYVVNGFNRSVAISYEPGVLVTAGIYVDISVAGGGTCSYQVEYDQ